MPLPPLVDPGPPLTPAQVTRGSRHLLLPGLGVDGQRRLRNARVLVVGAGGLGAPVLQYLAAAGVGTIGVVDDDVVDVTNLQRQVIHGTADVGRLKVDSARDAIAELDPDVRVVVHALRLDEGNVDDVLRRYDVVVDGTDNFPTRYLVNDACVRLGLPEVWGSVLRFDAQTTVFWGRPPAGVPAVQLRDLFPAPPPPDTVPSCAEAGVLGALCGQVGSVMATEAVKLVTGLGEPLLGRVLVVDALRGRWSEVPLVGTARPGADDGVAERSAAPVSPRSAAAPAAPAAPTAARAGASSATSPSRPLDDVVPTVTATELVARLDADPTTVLVDVREAAELAVVSVPGATHVPLARVLDGSAVPDLPRDRPVLVICQVGARSALAARTLRAAGVDAANVEGGVLAWLAARA
ncbi:ThiF family adenylyltransferase [Cellulomonas fimi]|uniref:UBA/THIF-type NAD/FAD binding protein n=1 Tax=Cellulomonas fimi (strain ATCC 484 / DSM 20113 / JCM 1341 / CCUG 24087 / LMG 16345 / NBRC 15513 / NCIMB 8980 / NCTC 7547 / NRS-133) TaxID=590998 RepID=F4H5C3_CELFA|nr:ThiF family adenylyltransferase [Cellulomonas fimi]AEE47846.1 UBA/THIF-type NAD/FAD binding protein [Cellulomonas fimi ATCC 484]NNH06016.1 adenylyltransferase/sulfurtransferase MoeZ [Cellulomonas fimi]